MYFSLFGSPKSTKSPGNQQGSGGFQVNVLASVLFVTWFFACSSRKLQVTWRGRREKEAENSISRALNWMWLAREKRRRGGKGGGESRSGGRLTTHGAANYGCRVYLLRTLGSADLPRVNERREEDRESVKTAGTSAVKLISRIPRNHSRPRSVGHKEKSTSIEE